MGSTIENVEFCPTGKNFVLSGARAIEIWSIDKAGVIKTISFESKPTSLCWLDENNILIGLNDGKLVWCQLDDENDDVSFLNDIQFGINMNNLELFCFLAYDISDV